MVLDTKKMLPSLLDIHSSTQSTSRGWWDRNPEPDVGKGGGGPMGAEIFFLTYVLPDAAEPK